MTDAATCILFACSRPAWKAGKCRSCYHKLWRIKRREEDPVGYKRKLQEARDRRMKRDPVKFVEDRRRHIREYYRRQMKADPDYNIKRRAYTNRRV